MSGTGTGVDPTKNLGITGGTAVKLGTFAPTDNNACHKAAATANPPYKQYTFNTKTGACTAYTGANLQGYAARYVTACNAPPAPVACEPGSVKATSTADAGTTDTLEQCEQAAKNANSKAVSYTYNSVTKQCRANVGETTPVDDENSVTCDMPIEGCQLGNAASDKEVKMGTFTSALAGNARLKDIYTQCLAAVSTVENNGLSFDTETGDCYAEQGVWKTIDTTQTTRRSCPLAPGPRAGCWYGDATTQASDDLVGWAESLDECRTMVVQNRPKSTGYTFDGHSCFAEDGLWEGIVPSKSSITCTLVPKA